MASVNESETRERGETRELQAGWPADPEDRGRINLILDLSPEANALLDNLAMRIHGTKSEVFRKAVGLFKLALDAREQGKRVGAVGPDQELDIEYVGF